MLPEYTEDDGAVDELVAMLEQFKMDAKVQQLIDKRAHLKKMLHLAKGLPADCPGLHGVIAKLETEILYIKIYLNCLV